MVVIFLVWETLTKVSGSRRSTGPRTSYWLVCYLSRKLLPYRKIIHLNGTWGWRELSLLHHQGASVVSTLLVKLWQHIVEMTEAVMVSLW